ncbi:MAG TPA: response regulator transcription factor [Candidatus Limnocylindrales bacterium]|nr:response regulator transcription factor [Candidatus Limnocylindrales bacterium]
MTTLRSADAGGSSAAPPPVLRPSQPAHWPSDRRIRVAMADDHHLIREGLRLVLSAADDFDVVGEAATQSAAFELVERTKPDVLLLDVTFPEGDGLQLVRALRALAPDLRVLVVTMHNDAETVREALTAGASGYVVKGAHSHELVDAIRAVARGERYLHSVVTAAIVDDSIRWLRTGRMSDREREILGLLASGHAPAAIAAALGISIHTVRRHIANLSDKLGVRGINGLTRYAIRHGLERDR